MGPAPHALFTASTHRTLVPLHYCSHRHSWPVPLTAGESKPQDGGNDHRLVVCTMSAAMCDNFGCFPKCCSHGPQLDITLHRIKRKLIHFSIFNASANCDPPGGTVGISVFFRKYIKLSHNQMIEGCHPQQFQRDIRFY